VLIQQTSDYSIAKMEEENLYEAVKFNKDIDEVNIDEKDTNKIDLHENVSSKSNFSHKVLSALLFSLVVVLLLGTVGACIAFALEISTILFVPKLPHSKWR